MESLDLDHVKQDAWSQFMFYSQKFFFPFFVFYIFKQVPIYFSCLEDCCKAVFTVRLQKCFVDYQTSSDFPSARE